MRINLLGVLVFALIGGCSSQEPNQGTAKKPVVSKVVLQEEDQESSANDTPMARLKKEVLIGGCERACETHEQAFQSYMTAAFDGKGGQATIPFLETSEMIHNGRKRGSAWVELWREQKLEQRKTEIASFATEVHDWVNKSQRDELEVSLANQVTFTEDDGPGFLAYYKPPQSALKDGDLREWKFRIQKRGWEWLISEITTRVQN